MICLFPKWKVISRRPVTLEYTSLLFGKEWKEERVVEIQENRKRIRRAFLVGPTNREKINYSYIADLLDT